MGSIFILIDRTRGRDRLRLGSGFVFGGGRIGGGDWVWGFGLVGEEGVVEEVEGGEGEVEEDASINAPIRSLFSHFYLLS